MNLRFNYRASKTIKKNLRKLKKRQFYPQFLLHFLPEIQLQFIIIKFIWNIRSLAVFCYCCKTVQIYSYAAFCCFLCTEKYFKFYPSCLAEPAQNAFAKEILCVLPFKSLRYALLTCRENFSNLWEYFLGQRYFSYTSWVGASCVEYYMIIIINNYFCFKMLFFIYNLH